MAPLTTTRPSTASRKRHSVGALLPPTVAWLEPLALSMHVDTAAISSPSSPCSTRRQRLTTHYTLTLQLKQHSTAAATTQWTLRRSLKDYKAFQKRLLERMQHGHFCSAECPWLFTFVKSYFPKQTLFRTRPCARLAQRRCDALLRCFTALQTFVLKRANHSCAVVVDHIAAELLQFVLQDAGPDHPLKRAADSASQWTNSNSSGAGRFSSDSVASTSDDDESSSATDAESFVCGLCDCSLEHEPCSSSSSSSSRSPEPSVLETSGASYTTTLSCSHAFHDECIVPKLNDAMQCPTCGTAQTSD